MEKLRRDHGWEKGLLTALFLLACFQNLTLASIGSGASLKWVHVFSLVFLPFLIAGVSFLSVSNSLQKRSWALLSTQ